MTMLLLQRNRATSLGMHSESFHTKTACTSALKCHPRLLCHPRQRRSRLPVARDAAMQATTAADAVEAPKQPPLVAVHDPDEWERAFNRQLEDAGGPTVEGLEEFARRLKAGVGKPYVYMSDLASEDKEGDGILQWVQLVMAGGGVLGIAHVGFVRMLELAGIRFLGVGGASAGAINAVLVAATRKRPDCVSYEATEQIMLGEKGTGKGAMKFDEFEDGKQWYKDVRKMKDDGKFKNSGWQHWAKLGLSHPGMVKDLIFSILPELDKELGAHKGDAFRKWMSDTLAKLPGGLPPVKTWGQLLERMRLVTNGVQVYQWDGLPSHDITKAKPRSADLDKEMQDRMHYPLRLVTTEITTQSMMVLPRDADLLYALQDLEASPADFARASMSIPVFFKPFRLPYETEEITVHTKDGGTEEKVKTKIQVGRLLDAGVRSDDWKKRNGYKGVVPEEAIFCDGGMLSNFPIRLFHEDWVENKMPLLPTIGVQLSPAMVKMQPEDLSSGGGLLNSVMNTARYSLDRNFIRDNEAYKDMLALVDCQEYTTEAGKTFKFDWLKFDMEPPERAALMELGMLEAAKFLWKWRVTEEQVVAKKGLWPTYKGVREKLYQEKKVVTDLG